MGAIGPRSSSLGIIQTSCMTTQTRQQSLLVAALSLVCILTNLDGQTTTDTKWILELSSGYLWMRLSWYSWYNAHINSHTILQEYTEYHTLHQYSALHNCIVQYNVVQYNTVLPCNVHYCTTVQLSALHDTVLDKFILNSAPANRKWGSFEKFFIAKLDNLAEWRHPQIKDKTPPKLEISK